MIFRRNKNIGDWGEERAVEFLLRQGFGVVERNYHATVGEIDIVATKNGDYYFIEVKTRLSKDLATDLSITSFKKKKLLKTINHYCYHRHLAEVGLIPAGIIIMVDKVAKKVQFHFVVLC